MRANAAPILRLNRVELLNLIYCELEVIEN
jgi:hypothetical protein